MNCTRCQGTGFLNPENIPDEVLVEGVDAVMRWIPDHPDLEVMVCDCCGNGEDSWYGDPGNHYTSADPVGKSGPYAYNGGLAECN
jgi:hypothetical protein